MLHTNESRKRRIPVVKLVLAIFLVFVAFEVFRPHGCCSGRHSEPARRAAARNGAAGLVFALKAYQTEYGNLPSGDHAQIIKTLRRDNPMRIVFFEARETDFSPSGEYLDPWKSPYRIGVQDPSFPWAYSFGKNRIDEGGSATSDDIPSWR